MNNGRKLIVALGASARAAPFRICAQPVKKSVVVGILGVQDQPSAEPVLSAFKQGLQELGYVEGKNLTLQRADRVVESSEQGPQWTGPCCNFAALRVV